MKISKLVICIVTLLCSLSVLSQGAPPPATEKPSPTDPEITGVTLISATQISDSALYFNGSQIDDTGNYVDRPGYDFVFGPHISPHGDCIDFFGKYVFLTWYHGGEENRHVMLSRYNTETGSVATIQFDHRHTGYLNNPNLGESHNTIAVGISPLDSTIHLLYDMHAYSDTRPGDGSLANDYFRYQYSVPGAVSVSDAEFTKSLFSDKQLFLKEGEDYTGLTYPEFFSNLEGELLVKMRRGGNNNGKFMFAKYNPTEGWSTWTDFNVMNASNSGQINYNWGLYGNFKYQAGKMRIGFATRYNINDDKFIFNNGFHYAYSNDPTGKTEWYNAFDEPFDLPLIDPDFLKISEPGDEVPETGANSVRISTDADWSVNDREDIHFINRVNATHVHTYKKSSDTEFTTSTEFPGGDLLGLGNNMYLVGLENSMPVIYRADGGTNDWVEVYRQEEGNRYMFGIARINEGHLYYYLMEDVAGTDSDANPIDLLIYNLADSIPTLGFLNLANNDMIEGNANLTVRAASNDPFNTVSLYVNDELVSTLNEYPYTWSDHPLLTNMTDSAYTLKLVATDGNGNELEETISIVTSPGQSPYTDDGQPHPIPGLIRFVDYDNGGEGIAYFDRSGRDESKYSYRGLDKVDMSPSGAKIVYIQGSAVLGYEWLEYTVNVAKTGYYDLMVTHEKGRSGEFDQLSVSLPDEEQVLIETFTGRDRETQGTALTDLMGNIQLTEGEHVIRFTMLNYGFDLESFELVESEADPIIVTFYTETDTIMVTAKADGTVALPPAPTKEGETFVQWVSSNQEPFDENTVVTENTKVYPQWALKTFTLSITSENGTIETSPDQTEYFKNDKVKLTATPAEGYEFVGWSGDITSSSNPVIITIDDNTDITAEFKEIEEVIVLESVDNTSDLIIYPNPSDERVYVKGVSKGARITLFDLSGAMLKSISVTSQPVELNVSDLISGQYILLIEDLSSKVYQRKIIVE